MLIATIFLLLLIVGLLLAPVSLHVHSLSQEIYVNVWNIFYARLLLIQSEPAVQLSFFSWKKVIYMLKPKDRKKNHPKPSQVKRKPWKRPSFLTVGRVRKILSSFRVRAFELNIDTRDVVWNAYLFPVSRFLLDKGYPIRINYMNHFQLDLVIENRLGRVLKALIASFF